MSKKTKNVSLNKFVLFPQQRKWTSSRHSPSPNVVDLFPRTSKRKSSRNRKLPTPPSLPTQPLSIGVLAHRRAVRAGQEPRLHVRPVNRRNVEPVRAGILFFQSILARIFAARTD